MHQTLHEFRSQIDAAARRLNRISDEVSARPRGVGKWSVKQIVGHLIDSAANNHRRFVLAQLNDDFTFQGYDQEAWVAAQDYQHESWPLLVDLWRLYNLHLIHVASCIPASVLSAPRHPHSLHQLAWESVDEATPVTLEFLVRDYIGHARHHLDQIFAEEVC